MAETFGTRLKLVAKKSFGSLRGLSETTGINYSQLSDYVRAAKTPGLDVLERLAGARINVHWLLTGEGAMMVIVPQSSDKGVAVEYRGKLTDILNQAVRIAEELERQQKEEQDDGAS